jgi:peptidoglycan/xylan/chitin deacetylase (PgdA/CDA1 family)
MSPMSRKQPPPLALTYHGVKYVQLERDPKHMFVRPRDLGRLVERLRKWGYELVTFGELARRAADGRADGSVALTFDDGFVDNFETLAPLLRQEDVPATVFVVSGWLGRPHPAADWTRVMDGSEVKDLAQQGVEIGAHTHTHPDLTTLSQGDAREELARSRRELERLIGSEVTVAAYPYGNANDETRAAAKDAGFAAACRTLGHGSWSDPFDLPRQAMENYSGLFGLRLKRDDRYEPLMRHKVFRGVRRVSRRMRALIDG